MQPPNSPAAPDDNSNHPNDSPRALKNGAESPNESAPVPHRGEIFEVELDENGQIVREAPSTSKKGAWFFVALAGLFCAYSVGAYVGQKSSALAPVGVFAAPIEKPKPLRIQIAGKVKKPGVYTLPGGSRLQDALKIAGGTLPNADLSALNLADWALDGSKIEIPARRIAKLLATPTPVVIIKEVFVTPPQSAPDAEVETTPAPLASKTGVTPPQNQNSNREAKAPAAKSAAKKPRAKPKAGKTSPSALAVLRKSPINLNQASAEQLATLPGVGPKMAERILLYRHENGGFKSIADLDNVKGIGEKRMATLQSLVRVK